MEQVKTIVAEVAQADGIETVRATVTTEHGFEGTATLPSGISVGSGEATLVEAARAVQNVTDTIAPALVGKDCLEQREFDLALMDLDGTPERSRLGANSLLAVSIAVVRAAAAALSRETYEHIAELAQVAPRLPHLVQVILEGGKHGPIASGLSIQELAVIGAKDQTAVEQLIAETERLLAERSIPFQPGAEGGIAPRLPTNGAGAELLRDSLAALNWTSPRIAVDVAASHATEDVDGLRQILSILPVEILEDPLEQDNLPGWKALTAELGDALIIAADDLTVGNPSRIKDAVKENVANGLVLKLTQVATLSELLDLIALARVGNWRIIASHRGHESTDDFLIDLAVGTAAEYLKIGTTRSAVRASKFARYQTLSGRVA